MKEGPLQLEFSVGQINHNGGATLFPDSSRRVDSKVGFHLRFSNLGAGRLRLPYD